MITSSMNRSNARKRKSDPDPAHEVDHVSEREQLLAAERDDALQSVRNLISILEGNGGFMRPDQQAMIRNAKALVGMGPIVKLWSDR